MKSTKILSGERHMVLAAVTLGLLGVLCVSLPVDAQMAGTATTPASKSAPDALRALVTSSPPPSTGCYHVAYSSTSQTLNWKKVTCGPVPTLHSLLPTFAAAGVAATGNQQGAVQTGTTDPVATTTSTFTAVAGEFPSATGITSETDVANPSYPIPSSQTAEVLGAGKYSLQLNYDVNTSLIACKNFGYKDCWVWGQFIYSTDSDGPANYVKGIDNLIYIQNWVYPSISDVYATGAVCPSSSWTYSGPLKDSSGNIFRTSCMQNLGTVSVPAATGTNQIKQMMGATATAGGNDVMYYGYGDIVNGKVVNGGVYSTVEPDSTIDLSNWWSQAEFNVVGGSDGTVATFNKGSSVTVKLSVVTSDDSFPSTEINGTTGE